METLIYPHAIIGAQFTEKVGSLIDVAEESIDIVVFDWRVYPTGYAEKVQNFNDRIFSAVERGVTVRALVNNQGILRYLNDNGVKAKLYPMRNLLHTKLLIVDGVHVVCGSHNYSESAMRSNEEVSVLFTMKTDDNDFTNYFNNLWPL